MKYLSEYTSGPQSELFDRLGAFFAFGQKSFDEKRREGVKYVNMGAGLLCPKDNAQALANGLEEIQTKGIAQDIAENGAEGIIEREYFNHECQITMSTEDAEIALKTYIDRHPDLFNAEALQRVFKACFEKAVEQDLF